ncbi:hypothetical protein [Pontiella sulfatireligans]|uniref:PEP-CTERM protein-sorting domain-containing protein n=1 Tax=Pontiella sulfatireligans TaxID=2750658 RepID=A0A6C2UPW0_9BACT|nr:hypothetical protein [Pontiella sulfatireligans]VGO22332.1 hypothetical protein SCARR_04415 [Pontiella sulfatireligans]
MIKKGRYVTAGLVLTFAVMQSQAVESRFTSAGNWTNAANWNNGVPGATDLARLQNAVTADIDSVEVVGGLNFRGDTTLGASIINVNNGGSLTSDGTQFSGNNRVGSDGDATLNINNGGSATFSGTGIFEVGESGDGDAGYVNIYSGGSLTVSQTTQLGADGSTFGYVNINGGTATFNNDLQVGNAASSHGVVTLTSGTLNCVGNLRITDNAAATGELKVNGGTLNATTSSIQVRDGNGSITQSAGAINANDMYVGHLQGSVGTMTMSGGTNAVSGVLSLGNQDNGSGANGASGVLVMSDGYMTVGTLEVGNEASTTGTLTLSGKDTYLKASTLSLGDAGASVNSSIVVEDGEFQIHEILSDGDSASESLFLEGGVLKLRHVDGATGYDDAVALIAADVLTWSYSGLDSLAATLDVADADASWTNGDGVTLYADTDGTNYSYMWAETIPEPATFGLIALFGGGLLFIRRRFRI